MMLSHTEENYLKAIYRLQFENIRKEGIGTNDLANILSVKPATVTDMLKKLKDKLLIDYEKYGKIELLECGLVSAIEVVRKHRLWETFLSQKLDFTWDEIHEVAEQLEHIQSTKLFEKLDKFLDYPAFDPHGDPIPKSNGKIPVISTLLLAEVQIGQLCKVVSVKNSTTVFLHHLEKLHINIGTNIKVVDYNSFDHSINIEIENQLVQTVSRKLAENLLVD